MTSPRHEGQAAVEVALVLPVVALVLLLVVQVALVVRDEVLVTHAAREAARAAAVDASPTAARRAAAAGAPLDPRRLHVRLAADGGAGGRVAVTLSYRSPTSVPIIGPVLPDVSLSARAAMRAEGGSDPTSFPSGAPPGRLRSWRG